MISTQEVVQRACPKIGALGPTFYFTPETLGVGKEHGLEVFQLYFLGRGGALGDAEPDVVTSAFGYFNPPVVAHMWTSAQAASSLTPREAGRLFMGCCQDHGRRYLSGVAGLDGFCDAAGAVNDAADRAGLALYAATAAEPLAEDLPARAMQLVATLREFRGSAHLLAVLATPGLTPKVAHGVKRPEMWTIFGYDEPAPAGTDELQAALAAAEALTDQMVAPAFDVLDEAQRAALLAGLDAFEAALPPMALPV